jgi:hypothetical protein
VIRLCAISAAAGVALFFAASAVFGNLGRALDDPRDFRLAVIHVLLAAYLPAARHLVEARARRALGDVEALVPDGDRSRVRALLAPAPGASRASGLSIAIGLVVIVLAVVLADLGHVEAFVPSNWSFEVWWQRLLEPWIGISGGLFATSVIAESARVSRAADLLPPLDLLDRRPFAPFTRMGLGNALAVLGLLSLLALFSLEQGLAQVVAALLTLGGVIGAAGMLLPLRGLRRRIAEAKARERELVDANLRAARDPAARPEPGRLADRRALCALRGVARRIVARRSDGRAARLPPPRLRPPETRRARATCRPRSGRSPRGSP